VFLALILGCLVWAGCSREEAGPSGGGLSVSKVVVALKPDKNPEQMLEERDALGAALAEKLGVPVEVIIPLSAAVIQEGFANGTVDLGYLSSTDMLKGFEAGTAEALLAGRIDGRTSYLSYWVSLADKPYGSVEDLRGKPVAFASRTSTSGYVFPHADLVERGLLEKGQDPEVFFGSGQVFYGTGYVSAVERVLEGTAEAAAVSYYVLDGDKHLSEAQRARLKKVAEQGPVPTHVIAVRTSLPESDRRRLREALLELGAMRPELRDRVFTSELVEVDTAEHVAPVRRALEQIGQR
ncbi:MAG: phosphate/phosphite/phosphonate ABC transporter substrate-binding protein, partial [Verrucomicrobiia bacterium]